MTFKDLKKRVTLAETTQQQQKIDVFGRLKNKPFRIWNIEEHKQEGIIEPTAIAALITT
jgi:hypothetical protein